jgi:hypothetical protein
MMTQDVLHTDALSVPKPLPTLYRIRCSWCGEMWQEGDSGAAISHGICPSCCATVMAAMDEHAFPGVPVES